MPRDLTTDEQNQVDAKRKGSKPQVYNPNGSSATEISLDFEAWLILTGKTVKQNTISQINAILDQEADKDYQDLFTEAATAEKESLAEEVGDLQEATSAFRSWREDPGVTGFQDTAEVSWMMQELQQGISPLAQIEDLTHAELLREAAETRLLLSKDSEAARETRLKAWLAALNAY